MHNKNAGSVLIEDGRIAAVLPGHGSGPEKAREVPGAVVIDAQAFRGNTSLRKVTLPEGFTMRQIFLRLEENKVSSFDDLMEAAAIVGAAL